jgi:hypothetical protein
VAVGIAPNQLHLRLAKLSNFLLLPTEFSDSASNIRLWSSRTICNEWNVAKRWNGGEKVSGPSVAER